MHNRGIYLQLIGLSECLFCREEVIFRVISILDLFSNNWGITLMGRVLNLGRCTVLEFFQCLLDVAWYGHINVSFVLVPVKRQAAIVATLPANGDFLVLSFVMF